MFAYDQKGNDNSYLSPEEQRIFFLICGQVGNNQFLPVSTTGANTIFTCGQKSQNNPACGHKGKDNSYL